MSAAADRSGDVKPIYVRVSRAQEVFGLHRSTLYRMVQRGELKIHKIGGVALVRRDDMERLIEGRDGGAA